MMNYLGFADKNMPNQDAWVIYRDTLPEVPRTT